MEFETITIEMVAHGVALMTLNRPDHANSLVPEMAREMMAALTVLEEGRSARVLVVTGAGRQFCAGADLVAMRRYLDDGLKDSNEPFNLGAVVPVTQRFVASPLPIVAAINGGATAGGLDLALACDIRIASRRAKLGETYVNLGLPPGNGGTYFLPRLVGSGMAAELALTGDVIDAERALAIGLVNEVVEAGDLLPRATELAGRIAQKPRQALAATKQALHAGWHMPLQTAMAMGYWAVTALHHDDDLKEGIDAVMEKRSPKFKQ